MLTAIHPKLPMRNKAVTYDFYVNKLGFNTLGGGHFPEYLMVEKDAVEIHFFLYANLDPLTNYGQVYIRTNAIAALYEDFQQRGVAIHPNGPLQDKPWGQQEFSILDPDNNLVTLGQRR